MLADGFMAGAGTADSTLPASHTLGFHGGLRPGVYSRYSSQHGPASICNRKWLTQVGASDGFGAREVVFAMLSASWMIALARPSHFHAAYAVLD
ncbi:hypothetical protein ACJBU6_01778 [Exserohilum turcicum]